jgi:RNA polymerase sigma-70 factor (ECF subfamily)
MGDTLEEWFIREVLCHEAALTRYLTHAWSNPADVPDLRQEIYVRVMEAAEKSRPLAPRYFLFTLAKNLIIDQRRKNRVVSIDPSQESEWSSVLADEVSPERRFGGFQQLARLIDAVEQLPERCREVVWLRKIEDLSQREIAARLKLAEGTVEGHLVRGMRILTRLFYAEIADDASATEHRTLERSRHEK